MRHCIKDMQEYKNKYPTKTRGTQMQKVYKFYGISISEMFCQKKFSQKKSCINPALLQRIQTRIRPKKTAQLSQSTHPSQLIIASIIIILSLCITIIEAQQASATGIASRNNPSIINFDPEGEATTTWRVTSQRSDVKITVSGPLSQYAVVSKEIIRTDDEDKSFTVIFKFPKKFDTPGRLAHSIGVDEIVGKHGKTIGTAINARWTIYIRVPYPGKYIETELITPNTAINQSSEFSLIVYNRGTDQIKGVIPRLDIYNSKDEHLKTFYLKEINTLPTERYDGSLLFDTKGYNTGEYYAVSTIDWPGMNITKSKFIIGSQSIRIDNYNKELVAGKINSFAIELFNDWDKVIESTYADIVIDEEHYKTPPITMGPWATGVLSGYIDARNLQPGKKNAKLYLYYDGKVSVQEISLDVVKRAKEISMPAGVAGSEPKPEIKISKDFFSMTNLLIATIILLLLMTVFMVTRMSRVETILAKQVEGISYSSTPQGITMPGQAAQQTLQPSQISPAQAQMAQIQAQIRAPLMQNQTLQPAQQPTAKQTNIQEQTSSQPLQPGQAADQTPAAEHTSTTQTPPATIPLQISNIPQPSQGAGITSNELINSNLNTPQPSSSTRLIQTQPQISPQQPMPNTRTTKTVRRTIKTIKSSQKKQKKKR